MKYRHLRLIGGAIAIPFFFAMFFLSLSDWETTKEVIKEPLFWILDAIVTVLWAVVTYTDKD